MCERPREIGPERAELVLLGRLGEERVEVHVEVVRANDVQIDDCAQLGSLAPAERLLEQLEGLGLAPHLLVPELYFVDRETDVVEPRGGDAFDIGLGEPGAPFGTPPLRLREPVRDVDAVTELEPHRRYGT